ncbi:acyl-CoA dehydrogenase family protein [Amycolatopsis pithecellobii]|uniref:Acyl-CoA dehydrogenase n=1 Tax=Amycolatopsis pithecellobii TaxID=664692 RepID=A0A6N7Z7N9_9PSEU|nr:acyl-CoA dehydrogenase family protein [Amycolatopsis pithecellobii]MTD56056.1 acyl-CoA dehydrogenase [Amycolatopsis pithecellobii]
MDFRETDEETRFRLELRKWLASVPHRRQGSADDSDTVAMRFTAGRRWHSALAEGGWLGLDWPTEYGGRGLDGAYQIILNEELDAIDAPQLATWVGVELVAPTLLRWGSPAQRERHLPPILAGTEVWCQGFSEPDAGSDLAAVQTTATRTETGFVLTGHKQWTSWAQFAQYALVLARTGEESARHRALTCFIVPLSAPGVRVTPIPMLYGDAEECDVHLDSVHVPADAVVGEVDQGWQVVMTSLSLARGAATLARIRTLGSLYRHFATETLAARTAHDVLPQPLALTGARLEALRFLAYRKIGEMVEDGEPGPIASTEKLLWARFSTQLAELALDSAGLLGVTEAGPWGGSTGWRRHLYRSFANEIEGGTNEIQRTIIARHVLGLPC